VKVKCSSSYHSVCARTHGYLQGSGLHVLNEIVRAGSQLNNGRTSVWNVGTGGHAFGKNLDIISAVVVKTSHWTTLAQRPDVAVLRRERHGRNRKNSNEKNPHFKFDSLYLLAVADTQDTKIRITEI